MRHIQCISPVDGRVYVDRPTATEAEIEATLERARAAMNRCDYLDPGLAWTGVKETGYGASLSSLGYGPLTRPKSYHLRLSTSD
jgi:acyl-CoA reductase-like NAD-dependent aldehyde dehydrogenase